MSSQRIPDLQLLPALPQPPRQRDRGARATQAVGQALLRLWKLVKPGDRHTATELLTMARGFERDMPTLAQELRVIAMRGMAGRD